MEEKSRAQELSVREISLIRELAQIRKEHGQYGQIYAEKFTSACLICKVFYGKMKAQ